MLEAHEALTPVGNPVAAPIPVAPVVAIVIFGESNVLIHNVGEEDGLAAVLFGDTVIVPKAFTEPHPPVNGML